MYVLAHSFLHMFECRIVFIETCFTTIIIDRNFVCACMRVCVCVCEREREREGREGGREKLTGRERGEEGERGVQNVDRREGQRGRRGKEGECGCMFGERLYEEADKRAFASSRAFFAFFSASGLGCTCEEHSER